MVKGDAVPETWLLNIDEHIAAGHIEEVKEAPPAPSAPIVEAKPKNKNAE